MTQQQITFSVQGALLLLLSLLVTATLHEFAHAYVADRLGDDTPRKLGRVSLAPLEHFDLMRGFALILFSLFVFGYAWGKPVPVNRDNFKNPRRDDFWVAASGPAVNLALAAALAVVMATGYFHLGPTSRWTRLIDVAFEVNVITLLLNFAPVPPFDGARMLADLLSEEGEKRYHEFLRQWGWIMLVSTIVIGGNLSILAANKAQSVLGGRYENSAKRHHPPHTLPLPQPAAPPSAAPTPAAKPPFAPSGAI